MVLYKELEIWVFPGILEQIPHLLRDNCILYVYNPLSVLLHRGGFIVLKFFVVSLFHIFYMHVHVILLPLVLLKSCAIFPEDIELWDFWMKVTNLLVHWHLKHKKTCIKVLIFINVIFEVTIDISYQK